VTGKRRVPQTSRIAEFPEAAAEQARWWERHILEVLHGLPPDAPEGTKPRPEFDPGQHSLAQRERAKAAELTAAGHQVSASGIWRPVNCWSAHEALRSRAVSPSSPPARSPTATNGKG
jgi:putative transposase